MVRQICSLVSEHFHGFMLQREAEEQQQSQETHHQQQQQVKAKMLKRLSKPEPAKSEKSSRATSHKASQLTEPSVAAQTTPPEASPGQLLHTYTGQAEQSSPRQPSPRQPPPPGGENDITEEIGRHFMAVTKEPSHRQPRAQASRGPNVKRLRTQAYDSKARQKRESDDDSIAELLPPIAAGKITKHDGNIVTQKLEDTTGIKVKDQISDYLILKGKRRARINPAPSSQVVQMEVGPPAVPPMYDKEPRPESSGSNVLRTSLLLEKMEEGEKETRIDGDGKETILVQTTMGEKETAIVGSQSSALLLPTSELGKYEEEEKRGSSAAEPMATPSSSSSDPPPVLAIPPPPPPPELEKPKRKPWPGEITLTHLASYHYCDIYPNAVLIGLNDAPQKQSQRVLLEKVSKALGDIEYSQFRRHWLDYQQCKIDVVQFFKKIKLLFRGSR